MTAIRIDKWLWFARFFRSRSLAAKAVTVSRVRVNRAVIKKPSATVRPGDVLTFPQGSHVRVVRVIAAGLRRGPAAEARELYLDLAPPVPADPATRPPPPPARRVAGAGRPTKSERRAIDRLRDRT